MHSPSKKKEQKKILLAYSGGLDTSVAIHWLKEKYGCEVVAVTVDVGQSDDLKEAMRRAKAIGAARAWVIDAKKEFAEEYIAPAIKANALYEGNYPLGTALARPLMAEKLVEMEKLPIRVTDDGRTVIDEKARVANCAMKWKDLGAFEDFMVERLTSS